jgi:anti-anti-sigma regulatory factor
MGAVNPMSVTCQEFKLPSRVSPEDLLALQTRLGAYRTSAFIVSAHAWRTFDSLTLQLLLSAARDWARRGQKLVVTGLSAEMVATLGQIGVRRDMLIWEEAQ